MSEYDDIKEALTELGATPRDVGLKLVALGCRGVREEGDDCPVFHYLTEVKGIDYIERVVVHEVWLVDDDLDGADPLAEADPSTRVPTPEPVREFIVAFDEGQWPDLEQFDGAS